MLVVPASLALSSTARRDVIRGDDAGRASTPDRSCTVGPVAHRKAMMHLCPKRFIVAYAPADGKHIPMYGIPVCMTCWDSNWDGWAPRLEAQVTAKLDGKGLPLPERNANGLPPLLGTERAKSNIGRYAIGQDVSD